MSNVAWAPVDEAKYTHPDTREEFIIDHDRVWVGAVHEVEWIILPAGLRICRCVQAEIPELLEIAELFRSLLAALGENADAIEMVSPSQSVTVDIPDLIARIDTAIAQAQGGDK